MYAAVYGRLDAIVALVTATRTHLHTIPPRSSQALPARTSQHLTAANSHRSQPRGVQLHPPSTPAPAARLDISHAVGW